MSKRTLHVSASNVFAIQCSDGKVPEWIQLVPKGKVTCLDGRVFTLKNAQEVVDAFEPQRLKGVHLPLDFEHATEKKARLGERVDAAGWVTNLEARDGSVWGQVEWNDSGRQAVESKSVKYISPVMLVRKRGGEVHQLTSVALTVIPAIAELAALAQQGEPMQELLALLGLPEEATEADIVASVQALMEKLPKEEAAAQEDEEEKEDKKEKEAASQKAPDLAKYVPAADYKLLATRLEAIEKTNHQKEVESEIQTAMKAGKIAPVSRESYVAICSTKEGLASFRDLMKSAPTVIGGGVTKPVMKSSQALSVTEKEICSTLGCDEADFIKTRNERG